VWGAHLEQLARIDGHAENIPVPASGESASRAALGMCGNPQFVIMRKIENQGNPVSSPRYVRFMECLV